MKPELELIDKALLIKRKEKKRTGKEKRILVIADLHIGYEEALNKQGIFIPRMMFREIMADLKRILERAEKKGKIDEIVILGDLKHEFGDISEQEWNETLAVLDFLQKECKRIVLIKGNHDMILEPILKKMKREWKNKVKIKEYYTIGGIAFLHGHKSFIFDKKVKTLVMAHMHPAVTLKDTKGVKQERYKCFLVGMWKNKKVIILPSFFPFIEGADVIAGVGEDSRLAFNFNLKRFDCYLIGEGGEAKSGEDRKRNRDEVKNEKGRKGKERVKKEGREKGGGGVVEKEGVYYFGRLESVEKIAY